MSLADVGVMAATLTLTAGATEYLRRQAIARNRMDIPNARSSHSVPTPRGGGLAIVLSVMCAVVFAIWTGRLDRGDGLALATGGAIVAAVGYYDDLRGLSAWQRFVAHSVAALIAVSLLADADSVLPRLHAMIAVPLVVLAVLWGINLFNFMDGIDGLAASQATFFFAASGTLAVVSAGSGTHWSFISAATAGACAGFLFWNWSPARIFMGDVGSGFLGYWIAALALLLDRAGVLSAWTAVILMTLFIADATVTLLRRMLRGEKWYEPHRSHAYQILSRRWHSHRTVSILFWTVNLLLVLPVAVLSVLTPQWAVPLAVVLFAGAAAVFWLIGAGDEPREGV